LNLHYFNKLLAPKYVHYTCYIYSHSPWENRAFYRIPNKMINKRHLFGHIYESSTLPPAHEIHLPVRKRIRIQRVRAYKLVRICAIEAFWRILGGTGVRMELGMGRGCGVLHVLTFASWNASERYNPNLCIQMRHCHCPGYYRILQGMRPKWGC